MLHRNIFKGGKGGSIVSLTYEILGYYSHARYYLYVEMFSCYLTDFNQILHNVCNSIQLER